MRIGCLQFSPQVGDVDNNMTRADRILGKGNPENLDLLVLPEMAFSGYNFKSLSEIHSSLEPTASGISSLWARTTALKHNCHVVVGYPEKADVTHKWPADPEYYNSAVMVGPDGDDVAHHRKAHLYYTDETWALEGNKGFYGDHVTGLGQTAIGICMDINPYKFEAPWSEFEFANHILHCDANLVVFSMAWLTLDDQAEFTSHPQEPDLSTLSYWAMRLEPLIRAESDNEIIIVFANRCGTEGDTLYAGTSAVLGIRGGEVNVYGLLSRCEKRLLVVDTNQAPIAKLVMTPLGIRLVQSNNGEGSPPHTTPSRSSARPGEGEKRERGSSIGGSRERHSTPSRSKELKSAKETGPYPATYDPPRQSLHRLTPVHPVQHTSPAPAHAKEKIQPPKLTIPDTGSRAWRKSDEAATGPPLGQGRTPVRKKAKDPFSPQVTRPVSRMPDSAVVLSAVERHRPGIFSPADSAIGRATPETRHRNSCRRSGEHRSSRHKEVLNVDTVLHEELAEQDEAALRAQTLKDSPVSRRPDSSVLSHWLEMLPKVADLEPLPATPPVEPKAPSASGDRGLGGCPVCHACGQEVPKGDASGVGIKSEKKRVSRVGAEGLGSKVVESGPCKNRGNLALSQPEELRNGVRVMSEGRRSDEVEQGRVRQALPQEGKDGGEHASQSQIVATADTMEETGEDRRSQDVAILLDPKAPGGLNGDVPPVSNEAGHTAIGNTTQQKGPLAGANLEGKKPTDPLDTTQTNGTRTANKMEAAERVVQDALAPRTRVVPPSIKGMEKLVTVAIRPSSVAW